MGGQPLCANLFASGARARAVRGIQSSANWHAERHLPHCRPQLAVVAADWPLVWVAVGLSTGAVHVLRVDTSAAPPSPSSVACLLRLDFF